MGKKLSEIYGSLHQEVPQKNNKNKPERELSLHNEEIVPKRTSYVKKMVKKFSGVTPIQPKTSEKRRQGSIGYETDIFDDQNKDLTHIEEDYITYNTLFQNILGSAPITDASLLEIGSEEEIILAPRISSHKIKLFKEKKSSEKELKRAGSFGSIKKGRVSRFKFTKV